MVTRNDLQNIADGAALAACRELGETYRLMTPEAQKSYICNPADIIAKAVAVGSSNRAGGLQGITIRAEDATIGQWDSDARTLTQTLAQPDAVRVIARRDSNANKSHRHLFCRRSWGSIPWTFRWTATAALTGQSTTEPGELELPAGISSYFYQDGSVLQRLHRLQPDERPSSCAGWTSFDISPPNDNLLRDILDEVVTSPGTEAGETVFNFIGGNLSNPTFDAMLLLFMRKGYDITALGEPAATDADGNIITGPLPDGYSGTEPLYELNNKGVEERAYYPDSAKTPRNRHRWETTVAVYDRTDCSNPNSSITIVGYSKITMTNVQSAPDKRIEGKIECELFSNEITRGGGNSGFGLKGTIPGLVE